MTVIQKKSDNPIAHLTAEDVELLGKQLDAIRQSVLDSRGESDARSTRTKTTSTTHAQSTSRAGRPSRVRRSPAAHAARALSHTKSGDAARRGPTAAPAANTSSRSHRPPRTGC